MKHCNLSFLLAIAACLMSFQTIYSADNNVRLYSYEDDSGSYYITIHDDTLTLSGLIPDGSGRYRTLEFAPCLIKKNKEDSIMYLITGSDYFRDAYHIQTSTDLYDLLYQNMEIIQTKSDSIPKDHIYFIFEFSKPISNLGISVSDCTESIEKKLITDSTTKETRYVFDIDLNDRISYPDHPYEFTFGIWIYNKYMPQIFIPYHTMVDNYLLWGYPRHLGEWFTFDNDNNLLIFKLPEAQTQKIEKYAISTINRINLNDKSLVLLNKKFKRVKKFKKPKPRKRRHP